MEAPTTIEIRRWSKVAFDDLEFEAPATPTVEEPDPLDVVVARAIDYILDVTGRTLEDIPTTLVTTAQEAVQRRTEQLAYKSQEDEAETASDVDMIQSFSAGSYSESRINTERATKFAPHRVNPWPLLNDMLMRLMTPEKLEWWREQWGEMPPAFAIQETDWAIGDAFPGVSSELFGA